MSTKGNLLKEAARRSAVSVTNETEENRAPIYISMIPPKQIAAKYGLSYTLVLLLAKTCKIAAIRTGTGKNGRILINEESLVKYLNTAYLTDEPPDEQKVKGIRPVGSEVWKRG